MRISIPSLRSSVVSAAATPILWERGSEFAKVIEEEEYWIIAGMVMFVDGLVTVSGTLTVITANGTASLNIYTLNGDYEKEIELNDAGVLPFTVNLPVSNGTRLSICINTASEVVSSVTVTNLKITGVATRQTQPSLLVAYEEDILA